MESEAEGGGEGGKGGEWRSEAKGVESEIEGGQRVGKRGDGE